MKQALIYSLKVWLTVTVLVPLVQAAINLTYECIKGIITVYDLKAALEVPVEWICFSLPCFILFFIAVLLLGKVYWHVIVKKVILSVMAILLLIGLTEVVIYKFGEGLLDWSTARPALNFFVLTTLIAIWAYKLESASLKLKDDITTP